MRDAVTITRSIGIQYLWIDALCIIQDDHEDWEREALKMAQAYTQSFITIAASSSPDGDGGCFYPPAGTPSTSLNWTLDTSAVLEKVHFRKSNTNRFRDAVLNGPLNQRAWVLQERSLSPRILYYTNDGLFWECEEAIRVDGNAPIENYLLWDIPKAKGFELAVSGLPETHTEESYHEKWLELVERYTACRLTHESDRLPALAGLAKVWAEAFKSRYVAGVMVDFLPAGLLWKKKESRGDLHSLNAQVTVVGLPSWSWCSFPGPTMPEVTPNSLQFYTTTVDNITVDVNGNVSDSSYEEVNNVTLELTGKIKQVLFTKDAFQEPITSFWIMPKPVETWPPELKFSFDNEPIYDTPFYLLGLYINNINSKCRCEYVLLMEKLGEGNGFRRIGVGEIAGRVEFKDKTSWFDDVKKERICIR
jgi:Heterokaryon incompatibility protein (HET)